MLLQLLYTATDSINVVALGVKKVGPVDFVVKHPIEIGPERMSKQELIELFKSVVKSGNQKKYDPCFYVRNSNFTI